MIHSERNDQKRRGEAEMQKDSFGKGTKGTKKYRGSFGGKKEEERVAVVL